MKLPLKLWALLISLTVSGNPDSHVWRSTLYPADWIPPHELDPAPNFLTDPMIQDFSYAGYHRGERPLPKGEGSVINAVLDHGADSTGATDSTHAIQSALDAAAAAHGAVVFLPEGRYRIHRPAHQDHCLQIRGSRTVLRGAGPQKTFLFNETTAMRNASVIRVSLDLHASEDGSARTTPIVRDYLGPTIKVEVGNASRFEAGDWIVIHNPVTAAFIRRLQMANPHPDGVAWSPAQWQREGSTLPGVRILRQIVSIDGNTLTLDAPTRWQLRASDQATVTAAPPMLEEVGIEALSIGNRQHPGSGWGENDYTREGSAAWDVHHAFLIRLIGVRNAWVRDLESFADPLQQAHLLSNGILLDHVRGVTLDRVRLSHAQYGGGGGNGYLVRLNHANECLVTRSEVGYCRHGIVQWSMGNSGNVFFQNQDHHSGVQVASGQLERTAGRGSDHHGYLSHSNLFDSHQLDRSYLEAAYRGDWGGSHGITASQTVFWNTIGLGYLDGYAHVVHSQQFGHGYIIGTSGPANQVRTNELRPNSTVRTHPVDWTEGIAAGESLAPQSLYLDQLNRRMPSKPLQLTHRIEVRTDHKGLEQRLLPQHNRSQSNPE